MLFKVLLKSLAWGIWFGGVFKVINVIEPIILSKLSLLQVNNSNDTLFIALQLYPSIKSIVIIISIIVMLISFYPQLEILFNKIKNKIGE